MKRPSIVAKKPIQAASTPVKTGTTTRRKKGDDAVVTEPDRNAWVAPVDVTTTTTSNMPMRLVVQQAAAACRAAMLVLVKQHQQDVAEKERLKAEKVRQTARVIAWPDVEADVDVAVANSCHDASCVCVVQEAATAAPTSSRGAPSTPSKKYATTAAASTPKSSQGKKKTKAELKAADAEQAQVPVAIQQHW